MPCTELSHEFRIDASPVTVFDHLSEPANYIGLSPLVVAVRDVRWADGTLHYTAVERLRVLGFVRHDNIIDVSLVATKDDLPRTAVISGEVSSPGRVRMEYRFSIAQHEDGSAITDVLRLRTPPGLLRFAASRARAVQVARARVLTQRLA